VVVAAGCSGSNHQASPSTTTTTLARTPPGPNLGGFFTRLVLAGLPFSKNYEQAAQQEAFAANAGDLRAARTDLQTQADEVRVSIAELPGLATGLPAPDVQAALFAANAFAAALQAGVDDPNDANFNGHITAVNQAQAGLIAARDQLVHDYDTTPTTTTICQLYPRSASCRAEGG
jgi:hypothetical protein